MSLQRALTHCGPITLEQFGRFHRIPDSEFKLYDSVWDSSVGCAAAQSVVENTTLHMDMEIEGVKLDKAQEESVQMKLKHWSRMIMVHEYKYGFCLAAVGDDGKCPMIINPLDVMVYHRSEANQPPMYLILPRGRVSSLAMPEPMDLVGVYELSAPTGGYLRGPLRSVIPQYRAVHRLQRDSIVASARNARPHEYAITPADKNDSKSDQKVSVEVDRGGFGTHQDNIFHQIDEQKSIMEQRFEDQEAMRERLRRKTNRGVEVDEHGYPHFEPQPGEEWENDIDLPVPMPKGEQVVPGVPAQEPKNLQFLCDRLEESISMAMGIPNSVFSSRPSSNMAGQESIHITLWGTMNAWVTRLSTPLSIMLRIWLGADPRIIRDDLRRLVAFVDGIRASAQRIKGSLSAFNKRESDKAKKKKKKQKRKRGKVDEKKRRKRVKKKDEGEPADEEEEKKPTKTTPPFESIEDDGQMKSITELVEQEDAQREAAEADEERQGEKDGEEEEEESEVDESQWGDVKVRPVCTLDVPSILQMRALGIFEFKEMIRQIAKVRGLSEGIFSKVRINPEWDGFPGIDGTSPFPPVDPAVEAEQKRQAEAASKARTPTKITATTTGGGGSGGGGGKKGGGGGPGRGAAGDIVSVQVDLEPSADGPSGEQIHRASERGTRKRK
jgi:hypothetical protein